MIIFRVECADSGDLYKVGLNVEDDNFSIHEFKRILSTFSGISSSDQILLIGPPYKSLDPLFAPNIQELSDTRIFLYNRRNISSLGTSVNYPQITLRPMSLPEIEAVQGRITKFLFTIARVF